MHLRLPLALHRAPVQFVYRRCSGSEFKDIFHFHEGIEFLYIEQGEGQIVTGSHTFGAGGGTLLFFQPFQLHKLAIRASESKPYVRSFIVYDPDWLNAYLEPFPRLADFHRRIRKMAWHSQAVTDLNESSPLSLHIRRMELLPQAVEDPPSEEACALFLIHLLELLMPIAARAAASASPLPPRRESHAGLAMEWMDRHFREPFRLQRLADYLHLTPAYVSGLFRKEVGESLTDYLTARRIKEACQLLETSDLAIERIAERVGMPNASHFCRLFRSRMGESPRRFRMRSRS